MNNNRYFGGIDPGLDGGFAVISGDRICCKLVMPTISIMPIGGKIKKDIDRNAVLSFLSTIPQRTHFVIEEQHPVRHQHITSTCTTCKNYGILLTALTAAKLFITEVPSDVWQSHFGIAPITQREGKTTKQQALEIAQMIYPNTDFRKSDRSHKAHDGMVDAACIAKYCQFLLEGEEKND